MCPRVVYVQQKLDDLLLMINSGASLSELEAKLNNPASGIVQKLRKLSEEDSEKWPFDKIKKYSTEYSKQYYEKNKKRIKKRMKKYYENNKEDIKAYQKEYREQNKEKIKEIRREYEKLRRKDIKECRREYYLKNISKLKKLQRKYREERKGKWKRFGNRLAKLIKGYKGNIRGGKKEFAQELKIHDTLLSHYLAGDIRPPDKFLRRLSEKFDISYEILKAYRGD